MMNPADPHRWGNNKSCRNYFLAYCLGMILGCGLLTSRLALPGFPLGGPADFTAFYVAGTIVSSGNAHRLFDPVLQLDIQKALLEQHGFAIRNDFAPFYYPPFFALIFVPLSFFTLSQGFIVWNLINLGLLLTSIWMLFRCQSGPRDLEFWRVTIVALAFLPIYSAFFNGQTSFMVLFLLTCVYVCLTKSHDCLAGAILGMLLFKPQFVALPFVYLLYCKRWRAAGSFLSTAPVLLCISLLMTGRSGLLMLFRLMFGSMGWEQALPSVGTASMPNIMGSGYRAFLICRQWFGMGTPSQPIQILTGAASVAVLYLLYRIWRARCSSDLHLFELQFGATIIVMALVIPHYHYNDLSVLVLAAFLLNSYFENANHPYRYRKVLASAHILSSALWIILPSAWAAQLIALFLFYIAVILQRELKRIPS